MTGVKKVECITNHMYILCYWWGVRDTATLGYNLETDVTRKPSSKTFEIRNSCPYCRYYSKDKLLSMLRWITQGVEMSSN